ncbi:hypothetical protein G6539_18820 [Streptomyces albidoflavus]|nr:hypothetical protein [Streptomyces albidoflavus]
MGRLAKEGIPADRAGELLDRAREAGLLTADATPAPAGAARNGAPDTAG